MPLCTIYRDRIQARTLASDHRRNGSSRPVALVHLDSLLAPHEIQIFFFSRESYMETQWDTPPARKEHITLLSFVDIHSIPNMVSWTRMYAAHFPKDSQFFSQDFLIRRSQLARTWVFAWTKCPVSPRAWNSMESCPFGCARYVGGTQWLGFPRQIQGL